MGKFTPGPWEIEIMPSGRTTVTHGQFFIAGNDSDYGLMSANAQLIAAAPDLLEALEKLLGQIKISGVNVWTVSGVCDAEKAIAKAIGAA